MGQIIENPVQAAMDRLAEERALNAMRHHRAQDFAAIKSRHTDRMSRRRLIQIYGQDLVDLALAP